MTQAASVITEETRFVTGIRAFKSDRWPMGRSKFFKLVNDGLIPRVEVYAGARPVYEAAAIDLLFRGQSDIQGGGQSGGQN